MFSCKGFAREKADEGRCNRRAKKGGCQNELKVSVGGARRYLGSSRDVGYAGRSGLLGKTRPRASSLPKSQSSPLERPAHGRCLRQYYSTGTLYVSWLCHLRQYRRRWMHMDVSGIFKRVL